MFLLSSRGQVSGKQSLICAEYPLYRELLSLRDSETPLNEEEQPLLENTDREERGIVNKADNWKKPIK